MSAVDEYFEGLDAPSRAVFEHLRDLATELAPGTEEGTSYGMAALKYREKPLLGFRTAKCHLSVFPFSSEAVEAVSGRLAGFSFSKGTIRFSVDRPLPDAVVEELIRFRVAEIDGSSR